MERANIRFYEREGLIAPRRMDNGYRDYSEEDLQILLRIKLLRSLHISLDEIKALKDGSADLADTLSVQIQKLERERQDVSYAQELCRAMQEDGAAFANLDARKYLEDISRSVRATDSSYFTVSGDALPQVFNPWRRYLARMLDLLIYDRLCTIIIALVFNVNLINRSRGNILLCSYLALAMMLFLEPLLLHLFGTTPGKAIFGLRIEDYDGRRLSYLEGLERTWYVTGRGLGYNIPIYSLARLWKSYKLCKDFEKQPWDDLLSYTLKDTKWYRGFIYAGSYVALIAVFIVAIYAQRLPPNRGDLTVAEFAQNYNYYNKLLEIDLGGEYLDESGEWAKKEPSVLTYVVEFSLDEKPEFSFTTENGYVTGVSLALEVENNERMLGPYKYLIPASLALAGAQRETGLFSKAPGRIEDQIKSNLFQSFHFTEGGVVFACDIEHSGYSDYIFLSMYMVPDKNATETYFSLNFSMNIQE